MEHKHKILRIDGVENPDRGLCAYRMEMDCPVQSRKCVVTKCRLYYDTEFDPHFSNEDVIARFRPTHDGWQDALRFIGKG